MKHKKILWVLIAACFMLGSCSQNDSGTAAPAANVPTNAEVAGITTMELTAKTATETSQKTNWYSSEYAFDTVNDDAVYNDFLNLKSEESAEYEKKISENLKDEANGNTDSDDMLFIDYIQHLGSEYNIGFFVKAYAIKMATSASYFEIYYMKDNDIKLLDNKESKWFWCEIASDDNLYYSCGDGVIWRISSTGNSELFYDGRLDKPADADESFNSDYLIWDITTYISFEEELPFIDLMYHYIGKDGNEKELNQKVYIDA